MENKFTIDSQPLLTESQYGNTQRQDDLDPIPEEASNTLNSSTRSNIFAVNSSFDPWASGDPSISGTQAEQLDHSNNTAETPKQVKKYEGMSTPDRKDCLRIEKIFEEEQKKEKKLAKQLEEWKGKHVAVERNNFNIIEIGLIVDIDMTPPTPILHLHTHYNLSSNKVSLQLPVSHILKAELIPFPPEFLKKVYDSYYQLVTVIRKKSAPHTGISNGIKKGEMKDYVGQHYMLELFVNNCSRNSPDTLQISLDMIKYICPGDMEASQIRIINLAYQNKGKTVELVTNTGIVYHGQCLGIYEIPTEDKKPRCQVQIILLDRTDSTWKQSFFAIEKVRYVKKRPKYELLQKQLQNCLRRQVEIIYEDETRAKVIKGIVHELTDEYREDNDYIHIHTETLPGKYDTTEGQSIYLHEIKVVTHGSDAFAPISISQVWSHQNEKIRVTLSDGTYYDGICLEPRRLEFEEDDFAYTVQIIKLTEDEKAFEVEEIDIQGVSLMLTLLRCKILSQKISKFFQTELFLIVNSRTFYEVKTKFKNIY